jgi:hypothetical protein
MGQVARRQAPVHLEQEEYGKQAAGSHTENFTSET